MGSVFIFTVLILPIQKYGILLHLFVLSLISFISVYIFMSIGLLPPSIQSLGRVQLFVTPWTAARQASLRSLLKLMAIESVMPSNHLILCLPLLLPPSIFPSIRVFSNESVLRIRWPNYRSFSFSISPSSDYSGLTSFRMGWLDLLCSPRDSKESSPTPQFKSINFSVLSFLYSLTLRSIHDYWKNHSFD